VSERELWRWVPGYENLYMVSSLGRVMSVPCEQVRGTHPYAKPGIEVTDHDNGRGYRVLSLYKNGVQKQYTVHRLVASAFIPNPEGKREVNHKDGNKANNAVPNLEWVTASENMVHADKVLHVTNKNRTLSEEQVIAIREDTRTEKEIAEDYGMTQSSINGIRIGKTYSDYGGPIGRAGRSRSRKLTQDQARYIRESDETCKALSQEFGVAASTICKIKKGYRYKEEPDEQSSN
jgi:hypothetical protein